MDDWWMSQLDSEKLVIRIYELVCAGVATAGEISAMISHQRASVSARLCQMEQDGLIVSTGRAPGRGSPKMYVRK